MARRQVAASQSLVPVTSDTATLRQNLALPLSGLAYRAWELMLTGRVITSDEADRIGLVTNVVPDEDLIETCLGVAAEIAGNSPFGVWMTKEVMWSNLEIPSLRAGIDMENRTQILASGTEDSREAMASFLTKSQVEWKNR